MARCQDASKISTRNSPPSALVAGLVGRRLPFANHLTFSLIASGKAICKKNALAAEGHQPTARVKGKVMVGPFYHENDWITNQKIRSRSYAGSLING